VAPPGATSINEPENEIFMIRIRKASRLVRVRFHSVLAYTEHHAVARRHPTEACCFGYILGWFAGWFGKQWQASSISRAPSYIRSLSAQAMIVVGVLGLVIAVAGVGSRTQSHVIQARLVTFDRGLAMRTDAEILGAR
jgi:hypothetical protein